MVYLGYYGTEDSKAKYRQELANWLLSQNASAGQPRSKRKCRIVTTADVILEYWRFCKAYYGDQPRSSARNRKPVLRMLRQKFGRTRATDFGPKKLKALRDELVASGVSRGYANKQVERVKQMFKWAVSEELVPASIYQSLATVEGLRKGRTAAPEPPKQLSPSGRPCEQADG
jgi:hypothetical protein